MSLPLLTASLFAVALVCTAASLLIFQLRGDWPHRRRSRAEEAPPLTLPMILWPSRKRSAEPACVPVVKIVQQLFLLNVVLQVWDGLASYQGILLMGVSEANPLVCALMNQWGVGWALLGVKGTTCVLLLFLQSLKNLSLSMWALTLTAGSYFALSFFPWLMLLLRGQ